jgi:hypothetical protein
LPLMAYRFGLYPDFSGSFSTGGFSDSFGETVRKGTDLLSVYPSGLSEKGIFGRFRLFLVLRIPAKFTLGAFLAFLFGQCLSSRHFRR